MVPCSFLFPLFLLPFISLSSAHPLPLHSFSFPLLFFILFILFFNFYSSYYDPFCCPNWMHLGFATSFNLSKRPLSVSCQLALLVCVWSVGLFLPLVQTWDLEDCVFETLKPSQVQFQLNPPRPILVFFLTDIQNIFVNIIFLQLKG